MMKCAQLDRNTNITNIWNFQQGSNEIPNRNIEIVIGHATPGNNQTQIISWETPIYETGRIVISERKIQRNRLHTISLIFR